MKEPHKLKVGDTVDICGKIYEVEQTEQSDSGAAMVFCVELPPTIVSHDEAMRLLSDGGHHVETRWRYDATWEPVVIGTMLSTQPSREWRVRKK